VSRARSCPVPARRRRLPVLGGHPHNDARTRRWLAGCHVRTEEDRFGSCGAARPAWSVSQQRPASACPACRWSCCDARARARRVVVTPPSRPFSSWLRLNPPRERQLRGGEQGALACGTLLVRPQSCQPAAGWAMHAGVGFCQEYFTVNTGRDLGDPF
jgi:hypothetical protein